MRLLSAQRPGNPFEERVLTELAASDLDGVVSNNLVIPNVRYRWLPDEHDIVLYTAGNLYVIDAKELDPGFYRGEPSGAWEYSRYGDDFAPVVLPTHPWNVAFGKQKRMIGFLSNRTSGMRITVPGVVSVIAVPDHADTSGLGWDETGKTETGVRLMLAPLGRLVEIIRNDSEEHAVTGKKVPDADAMAEVLGLPRYQGAGRYPMRISEHIEVIELVGRSRRPVAREEYRGYHHEWQRPVRIEILRKSDLSALDRHRKAIRAYYLLSKDLRHPAMLQTYDRFDVPGHFTLVTEWFSATTLGDYLEGHSLPWERVREIFRPVVGLLQEAHARGVAHRFLDPSAILVSEGPPLGVRLGSFYGAIFPEMSVISYSSAEDTPYGAPEAPELAPQDPRVILTDLFALGRCMVLCLTGDPLGVPNPRALPAGLADALASLTAHEPGAREAGWEAVRRLL